MNVNNIAVVRGVVSAEPRPRELRDGTLVTNVELTTQVDSRRCSVPVVVYDRAVTVAAGDEVVIAGSVVRRFFRAGGTTASRTEVVAERILPVRQRRRVERLIEAAIETLRSSG